MIVALDRGAEAQKVRRALTRRGLWVQKLSDPRDGSRVQFLVRDGSTAVSFSDLLGIDGVASIATPESSHPLLDAQPSSIQVRGVRIGVGADADPVFMAGPCSVESSEQIFNLAAGLAPLGVRFLRGGAYKPRTSPYSFQGHGTPALRWLRDAADAHGMLVVTEALGVRQVEAVAAVADLIQIGSRNMHHSPLLRSVGTTGKPVLLKRGMAATLDEWLQAAECCLLHGAAGVVFCERGIRGFDRHTRNVLDLGAVEPRGTGRRLRRTDAGDPRRPGARPERRSPGALPRGVERHTPPSRSPRANPSARSPSTNCYLTVRSESRRLAAPL